MFYFSLGPMFLAAYLRDWGLGNGDCGLGTGDWGLGTGDWGLIAFDILTVNRHDKIVVPLTRAVGRLQNKTR